MYLIFEWILLFLTGCIVNLVRNDVIKCNEKAKIIANFIYKIIPILWIIAIFLDPISARFLNLPTYNTLLESFIGNTIILTAFYLGNALGDLVRK